MNKGIKSGLQCKKKIVFAATNKDLASGHVLIIYIIEKPTCHSFTCRVPESDLGLSLTID
jgi:hypothetical protein